MRVEHATLAGLVGQPTTHIYICGLKGMEAGVEEALADICRKHDQDWSQIKPVMRAGGRYHVETY
jgi:benzoyl-CoA 2,3-dioxygenase component A